MDFPTTWSKVAGLIVFGALFLAQVFDHIINANIGCLRSLRKLKSNWHPLLVQCCLDFT